MKKSDGSVWVGIDIAIYLTIQITFIILKIVGVFGNWKWLLVLLPTFIQFGLAILILLGVVIALIIGMCHGID